MVWGLIDFLKCPEKPSFFCPVPVLLWEVEEGHCKTPGQIRGQEKGTTPLIQPQWSKIRNGGSKEL